MELRNNRVDRSKEAGSTSGSKQGQGWSYWRQYCKSLLSGKSLDEEATKVSPQASETAPLLDAGQKRKHSDESSSEEVGRSREAGNIPGSKRPRDQSDSQQSFEVFESKTSFDEDNRDHSKYPYLTEEYGKMKDKILDVRSRYKELQKNNQSFKADEYKEQIKNLIDEIVANFEDRCLNVVDIIESLKNDLEKKFNEKNKKLSETDKDIWKYEEIKYELNKTEEMEAQLKGLQENIICIPHEMSNAFIDKQIQKSETIEYKYAEPLEKYPWRKNNPEYEKWQVENNERENFSRMSLRKWTDVEIQLERYKACIISKKAHRELSSKWKELPYLRDIPLEQAWRLCVNKSCQKNDNPEFIVDKEPSYLAGTKRLLNAMLNGLCIDDLNFDGHSPKELTAEYYQQLHDIAVEETYLEVQKGLQKRKFPTGYAHQMPDDMLTAVDLVENSNLSHGGKEELQEKIDCQKGGKKPDVRYGEAGHPVGNSCNRLIWNDFKEGRYWTKAMARGERRKIADAIITKYHEEITNAKKQNDEEAKLTAIVRCCQDLYQSHLFADGNTRTIVAGVLPKLLLENGFCPSILHDAKILGGFSVEEIKQAIRKGQETFQSWCEQTPEQYDE